MIEIVSHAIEIANEAERLGLPNHVAQTKFQEKTCDQLAINAAQRIPFMMLNCEISLLSTMEFMIKKNLKRVAVECEKGDLIGILSQSQLVKFLLSKINKFEVGDKTIQEFHLGYRPVVCVAKQDFVRDAFLKLCEVKITGAAVMDDDKLIGNFSISDFKFANSLNLLGYLHLTIEQFLQLKPPPDSPIPSPICVRPQTTILELLEKIRLTGVHRLYLVDDDHLIGVISLKDIVELILQDATL